MSSPKLLYTGEAWYKEFIKNSILACDYYYYYYYFIRQRISNIDDKCQQKILQPLERRGQKKLT